MSTLLDKPKGAAPASGDRSPLVDIVGFCLALAAATALGVRAFAEPDLWWHLRVGEHIRSTGQLVGPDPWAIFAARDYMATQWLPEVVASWAYEAAGIGAVLWLRCAAVVLLASVVFVTCRRDAGPAVSAIVTVLGLLGSTASLNPRPQLLSFLFFALTVMAWRATARDHQPRWWLVPMFWLWACSHGLWLFGLAVGVLTTLALFIDRRNPVTRSAVRQLLLLNGLSAVAIAITPLGPELLLAPLRVSDNASWIANEWQRTPFDVPASLVAATMVLVTVGLYLNRTSAPLWRYTHLGLAALLLVWMWRLVPLSTVLSAPLLAAAAQQRLVPARMSFSWPANRRMRVLTTIAVMMGAGLVCTGDKANSVALYPSGLDEVDAVLTCQQEGSVIFNDFGLSGWLLWRHQHLSPVADLRVEIYSRDHLKNYYRADEVKPGWQSVIDSTGAHMALLQPETPLASALMRSEGWQLAASSPAGVLLYDPKKPLRACS
jgi:hypothetical protein